VFWRAVADTVKASPAVLAYDLINEPVVPSVDTPCWLGPDPDGQPPSAPGCQEPFGGSFFVPNLTRTPAGRAPGAIAQAGHRPSATAAAIFSQAIRLAAESWP
jgi:hypothetical protein